MIHIFTLIFAAILCTYGLYSFFILGSSWFALLYAAMMGFGVYVSYTRFKERNDV
jgi:hypothetical protein